MTARSLFSIGPDARARWAAMGKALAYIALALVGALLVTAVAKSLLGASLIDLAQQGIAGGIVRAMLLFVAVVVLPTLVMLAIGKESFALSGWSGARAGRLALSGVACGGGLLFLIAATLWLVGAVDFKVAASSWTRAGQDAVFSLMLWVTLAAGEEGLHRGYAFAQACRALSFWPAAIVSSAWFMFGHVGNPGETGFGIVATGILALALSYSVLTTGSLWFALGFHAAWNFTQSFVFGLNNSGGAAPASLMSADVSGAPYLTGGTAGPEGSILVVPAVLCLFVVLQMMRRRTNIRHSA